MRRPHAPLEYLIHVFHRMHHGCMRHEFEQRGLGDIANPPILFLLVRAGGRPITQRQIAQRMGVSAPTVAVAIKRMQKAGLVSKQTDEADLRKNYITLTDAGRDYAVRMVEAERAVYRHLIEGFQGDEIETMRGYYLRMIDNMQRHGCHRPDLFQNEIDEEG